MAWLSRIALVGALTIPLLLTSGSLANAVDPADPAISVRWQETADTVQIQVENRGFTTLDPWELTVPFPHVVDDVTGAVSVQNGSDLLLTGVEPLPVGGSTLVTLRYQALDATAASPATCVTPLGGCELITTAPPAAPRPSPTSVAPEVDAAGVRLSYRVADDWGSGQTVIVSVTNETAMATSSWQVAIPAAAEVTSVWDGVSYSGDGAIRVANAAWNGYLSPGETLEFQVTVEPGGSPQWPACEALIDDQEVGCAIDAPDSWLEYPELPQQW